MNLNDYLKKPKEEIIVKFDKSGYRIETPKQIADWEEI